ncbi:hypothetical protein [Serratia ficaria]|uniref:Uncharacterized protein n=1 Tax=Serratia ficaria TaxID=61651 RepID=A0A240CDU9_SERFI|nr:hypothetical protein [Serratia ficaria]REF42918.1 hypothetical protein C7332_1142 [Serratia ficaria]CAI0816311.1 Uncharacterised protein [Serratia ficaria]CAI1046563.1 Uncharacterised protein [Serratia ficaria]CAI1105423.1 Uncharacterised protein [Serratia ficaria]CAI1136882.1 Uncharacterised protein [Serratia ficaria]
MTKNGWAMMTVLAAMALWTLLAWGAAGLLGWLPVLVDFAGGSVESLPVNGMLSLVPQTMLDAWLPWLKQLGGALAGSFPTLLAWAGYAVWLLWGLGMLALALVAALARRCLAGAQR